MPDYRVALRHTTLVETAPLVPRPGDTYFIATTAPPPTNSILTLHDGEETRFFVVDGVVEVDGEGRERGILGKLTDEAAHEEASKLGTEHLEDGTLRTSGDDGTPQMAMPAPVVDPDPSEEVDVEERARLEAQVETEAANEGEASNEAAASEGGEQPEAQAAQAESQPSEENANEQKGSGRRGRKRRGRKRR